MKITGLKIKNYRAFRDISSALVAPLTLVFGQNNAGKSSIVRILASLVNSCSANERLAFNPVALSDWQTNGSDFIYGKGTSTKFEIGFSYEYEGNATSVLYEIFNIQEHKISLVSRLIFTQNNLVVADFEWAPNKTPEDISTPQMYLARHLSTESNYIVELKFQGIQPIDSKNSNLTIQDQRYLSTLQIILNKLISQVHWLGPLRHTPARIEQRLFQSNRMTSTGKEASQILAYSYKQKTPLFERVSAWFETALMHRLIFVDGAFDGSELFGLTLSPLNASNIRIPIADTGTGIAQVLPIILLGELAATGELGKNPILVFENPELHLHDSIHDDLGRFFAKVIASQSAPTLVVETHSENILLAIQIAIAEKEMISTDVAVNWVRCIDDGSSTIENILFDFDGFPSSQWPIEAFSTAPNQSKKLFSIRQHELKEKF